MEKILITLTGPSLTGKSMLEQLLVGKGCKALVSTTTRSMRDGEVDGKHYHFMDKDSFSAKIQSNDFIEHVNFDGNFYGISKSEAEKAFDEGKPAVLVCEPGGAEQIRSYGSGQGWRVVQVFVDNPVELLVERFLTRFKGDSKASPEKYAARLLSMMTVERSQWVEPARSGSAGYDVVLESFTPADQDQAVEKVLAAANGLSSKPKRGGLAR